MDRLIFTWKKRYFFLLTQIIVLIICVFAFFSFFIMNVFYKVHASHQTVCLLLDKKMTQEGSWFTKNHTHFLMSYQIDGVQYEHWIDGVKMAGVIFHNRFQEKRLYRYFKLGQYYSCWYNPSSPQSVMILNNTSKHILTSLLLFVAMFVLLYLTTKNFSLKI